MQQRTTTCSPTSHTAARARKNAASGSSTADKD